MGKLGNNAMACARGADLLKAVSNPLRLQIVAILCEREQNVNQLAGRLGVQQSIVSQQLRILRMHRLVAATRAEGFATYRLLEPHLKKMIQCLEGCLSGRAK